MITLPLAIHQGTLMRQSTEMQLHRDINALLFPKR